jgi:hypothetical protein
MLALSVRVCLTSFKHLCGFVSAYFFPSMIFYREQAQIGDLHSQKEPDAHFQSILACGIYPNTDSSLCLGIYRRQLKLGHFANARDGDVDLEKSGLLTNLGADLSQSKTLFLLMAKGFDSAGSGMYQYYLKRKSSIAPLLEKLMFEPDFQQRCGCYA